MIIQEDGTHGPEKEPDAKDAMTKLNQLIALRFDDSSGNMVKDPVLLKAVVEQIIASPEKETIESTMANADINKEVSISLNDAVILQQGKLSHFPNKAPDPEQEWQNKLNELASTSFAEISYESCELKLQEPESLKLQAISHTVPLSASHAATKTESNTTGFEPVVRSATGQQENTVLVQEKAVTGPAQTEKKESYVPIHKGRQKETSVSDTEKQIQTSGKVTTDGTRDIGRNTLGTEDIVSIIEVLDSIESDIKKKELPKDRSIRMAGSKKNIPEQQTDKNTKISSSDAFAHKVTKGDTGITAKVAVLYSEAHVTHSPKNTNVQDLERPERLTRAMDHLQRSGIFGERCDLVTDKYQASEEDLLLVHSNEYVRFVRSYSASGGGFLGDSTYMTSNTFEVAQLAVGSAIKAGELVLSGQYAAAMVMIRPPGHHAGVDKYRGFCIFNNVAVLARYLQKKKGLSKIMIIDWDAHAGDGTMEIFYNDPTVMVVSLHRDPHDFYPRRGFSSQTGEGPGLGYTVNVEMPMGAGDEEYAFAFDELVIPLLHRFSPDFVICSCGFDAYFKEQHIKLNLTSAGYHMMAKKIMSVMNGNFVLVMEGGYHKFNGHLTHVVINSLLGLPDPVNDKLKTTEYERNQQNLVLKETAKKIIYVKDKLGIKIFKEEECVAQV
ncbi:MAG: histone deacetylase [Methanomethylovorans sp.]|nr:histone deacetylase [Methanomethylovorans sp.]